MSNSEEQELSRIAKDLAQVAAKTRPEVAILGFMTGSLYSLRRAIDLEYENRGEVRVTDLRSVLAAVDSGIEITERDWLSGFYFNAAIMRLAAINERLGNYAKEREDITPIVRR